MIAKLDGAPRVDNLALPPGCPALERAIGGWPRPGLTELTGRPGSGRLSLVLPAIHDLTHRDRPVAVVDPFGVLFPPGLASQAQLKLERLLVVQPAPERAGWAGEQIAASGCFELVIQLAGLRLGRSGPRLTRAAERGGCAVVVISERSEQALPAALRVEVWGRGPEGVRGRVLRRRGGRSGVRFTAPVALPRAPIL
jgi:hypothetical protein